MKEVEKKLLNDFQQGFPLTPRPYAVMAERLGVTEDAVIEMLRRLQEQKIISRVGAVFKPNRVGASTLAALSVPEDRLVEVAAKVSQLAEVNHNYEREHSVNLWFVVTATDEKAVCDVLQEIERTTGLHPLYLPLLEEFHIDLGFPIQWN